MSVQIRHRQADPAAQASAGSVSLMQRLLLARQAADAVDIALPLKAMLSPSLLKGMDQAVALLAEQLTVQGRILIVSDFDADGATSCALAMRALRSMGFQHVSYIVPNRFEYGYGLTPEIVALAGQSQPDLLITVDNGISSVEGVAAAHAAGMKVLITDHHLPGRELPAAEAIVNPNQQGCDFPSKSLAGVGVIFYVMTALRAVLRAENRFAEMGIPEPRLGDLLDLVALGTVADVVPLDRNNRILVKAGLQRLSRGQGCPGINALLKAGKRDPDNLVAADLAFAVAPRLNAAGRLDDMSRGIELLLSDSAEEAEALALTLDAINEERKQIESGMKDQALQTLAGMEFREEAMPAGLCLYDADWHQGVIGILAARVKEKVHRPVIAFANAGEDELKGSARSVPGVHIRDILDAVATRNPGLITRFGGHAMAAGLSLDKADFDRFSLAFAGEVAAVCTEETLQRTVVTDGRLGSHELCLQTAELIRDHGPWGQGFPEPLFDGCFQILDRRILHGRHLKLVLACADEHGSTECDAIAFNLEPDRLRQLQELAELELVYRLDINHWRGRSSLQLMIEHIMTV